MDYGNRYLKELKESSPSYYEFLQETHTLLDLSIEFQERAVALEESLHYHYCYEKDLIQNAKSRKEEEITKGFISKWIVNHVYSELEKVFSIKREEYYENYH